MTRAHQILELLRSGPRTYEALLEQSGMPAASLRMTICDLKRSGYLHNNGRKIPVTYSATEKAEGSGKPKIDWTHERYVPKVKPVKVRQDVVSMAIRSNPNSVFQLGAMA